MTDTLLWNLAETARQLGGVSTRTIERLIADGEFPVIRVRHRRMIEAALVRRWLATQNDRARARMEERPCPEKPTVTVSINNPARRTGTAAIPMRTAAAAAEVQARITAAKQKRS